MKVGDDGDVPRVTRQGARQEAVGIVNEVGGDDFYKFLRELGDWGRTPGGYSRGTSVEQPLDFGFGSIPKPIDKEFVCYRSVNTTKLLNNVKAPVNEDVGVFETMVVTFGVDMEHR